MTRGLVSAQTNILDDVVVQSEILLQIQYNSQNAFFTTGGVDTTATTDTSSGSQVFRTSNLITGFSTIYEKPFGVENRIAVIMGGDVTSAMSPFGITPLAFVNNETRFILHKLFRNVTTNTVESADPIKLFDGRLVKKNYTVGELTKTLVLEIQNKLVFSNKTSNILTNSGLGVL